MRRPLAEARSDATGPAGTASVELRFATVSTAPAAFEPAALTIRANVGIFEIADVQFILSEFGLEGTETCTVSREDGEADIDDCEFESGSHLVDLPLAGGAISLGTGHITEGTYTFIEFDVHRAPSASSPLMRLAGPTSAPLGGITTRTREPRIMSAVG